MQDIIAHNIVGLYAEPSTDSEQVTQGIMGQRIVIEQEDGEWLRVQTWDGYHGWIRSRFVIRSAARHPSIARIKTLFSDALKSPDAQSEIHTKLVITTELELLHPGDPYIHVRLPDGKEAWLAREDVDIMIGDQSAPSEPTGEKIVRAAKRFLGIPYLWGGTTPFGLDCSGFTQLVYKLSGINLLRDARIQADDPRCVSVDKPDAAAGDLVFFAGGDNKTRVTHVGISCGDGTFVHAAGGVGVTINSLDDDPYGANYWGVRRMLR
jgi:gamma-D-glutamyl-L-lysine dipeptidyl-peptidase